MITNKKKIYIVIHLSTYTLNFLTKLNKSNNLVGSKVIATNRLVQRKLAKAGISSCFIEDYIPAEEIPVFYEECYTIVKEIGKAKIDNIELRDLLSFNGVSLWDTYDSKIWSDLLVKLPPLIFFYECLRKEKPSEICVIDDKYWFENAKIINQMLNLNAQIKHQTHFFSSLEVGLKQFAITIFQKGKKFRPIVEFILLLPRLITKYERNNGKKKILFFVSTRNHFVNALPVIRMLQKRNDVIIQNLCMDLFVLGKKAIVSKLFLKEGISHNHLQQYANLSLLKKVFKGYKHINHCQHLIGGNLNSLETVKLHGINLTPLLTNYIIFLIKYELQYLIYYVELIREMLDKEKPDMVALLCEFNRDSRSLIRFSKERKIPLYYIEHSIIYDGPLTRGLDSDYMAVEGSALKKRLENYGVPSEKLIVTGRPVYDEIIKTKDKIDVSLFKKFGLDKTKKIVLLATNPYGEDNARKLVSAVVNAINKFDELQLIIKPHPRESVDFYQRLLDELNFKNGKAIDYDTFELIKISELVIVVTSTVGLEAMLCNKPVISINLFNLPEAVPYVKTGSAIGVYQEDEVEDAIRTVLYNDVVKERLAEARKIFIENHNYKNDGKATERVVNSMLEILNRT